MDGPRDCHTEGSTKGRERQISSYMWNLKKKKVQMNLLTKQKLSYRCRKQTYIYQGGSEPVIQIVTKTRLKIKLVLIT